MGFWQRGGQSDSADYAWAYDTALVDLSADETTLPAAPILVSDWNHRPDVMEGWFGPEPDGRWTSAHSVFPLYMGPGWSELRIVCVNHHRLPQTVTFSIGAEFREETFEAGTQRDVIVPKDEAAKALSIDCTGIKPSAYDVPDDRNLGIFVKSVEYA